jgi:hypothetical protein
VIQLAAGTYGDQTIVNDPAKGNDAVTFRPAARASVILQGQLELGANIGSNSGASPSNVVFSGFEVRGNIRQWWEGSIQPKNLVFRNLHIRWTSRNGLPALTLASADRVTVENVEIGPTCCNTDGIVIGKAPNSPNPSNFIFDRVYVHDIANNCANYTDTNCSNFAPSTPNEVHVDCFQAYGGDTITIRASRFFNCATQGIFAGSANGGTFSNWTVENTMVGGIPGGLSDHSIVFGSAWRPGDPPIYRGNRWRFLYNTTDTAQRGAVLLYPSGAIDPNATFVVAGNITIFDTACDLPGRWIFSRNLFTNKTCGPSDVRGSARVVKSSIIAPDLRLQRDSPGLGQGDPRNQPPTDIDGKLRPRRLPPDIGASQRETARIILGKAIGEIAIGEDADAVEGFYGKPSRITLVTARGHRLKRATYRIHRAKLWVDYSQTGTVVGIGTTSAYYSTTGRLGPGSKLAGLGRLTPTRCQSVFRRAVGGTTVQFRLAGTASRRLVRSVEIVRPRYDRC